MRKANKIMMATVSVLLALTLISTSLISERFSLSIFINGFIFAGIRFK